MSSPGLVLTQAGRRAADRTDSHVKEIPMIPIILSGGSGSRLWPLSRKQFPKQFLALTGEHTMFQQTLERLVFEGMQPPVIVCNKDHRFIVQEQLSALNLASQAVLME